MNISIVLESQLDENAIYLNQLHHNIHFDQKLVCVLYGMLCCFGLLGNGRVNWILLRRLLTSFRRHDNTFRHLYLYLLSLGIVGFLVLLCLPVVIGDMVWGQWGFGTVLCRFFWGFESFNKIFSTLLMLVLSLNCYIAVCRTQLYPLWKDTRTASIVLILMIAVSIAVISPVVIYSGVFAVVTETTGTVVVHQKKCLFDAPSQVVSAFTTYVFSTSLGATTSIQLLCYSMLLWHLYKHRQQNTTTTTRVPFMRVLRTVILLVVFHVLTWTPYWILTLSIHYSENTVSDHGSSTTMEQITLYLVHALPYINAALNPSLYVGLLKCSNREHAVQPAGADDMYPLKPIRRFWFGKKLLLTHSTTKSAVVSAASLTPDSSPDGHSLRLNTYDTYDSML